MAVPPPQVLPGDVIDLTGDDDNNIVPPPRPLGLLANGHRPPTSVVDGHHGSILPIGAGHDEHPAKRVKLTLEQQPQPQPQPSEPKPCPRLSGPLEHFANQITNKAVQKKPQLRRADIERKISEGLLQKYGSVWPRDNSDVSMAELKDIWGTGDRLIAQLEAAALLANQNPPPAPSVPPAASAFRAASTPSAPTQAFDVTTRINESPIPPISLQGPAFIDLTEEDAPTAFVANNASRAKVEIVQPSSTTASKPTKPPIISSPQPRLSKCNVPSPGTPKAVKRTRAFTDNVHTSPQNFRSRAKKAAWKSDTGSKDAQDSLGRATYFAIASRPYLNAKARDAILRGNGRLSRLKLELLQKPEVFHVDFRLDEARDVRAAVRKVLKRRPKTEDPFKDLAKLLHKLKSPRSSTIATLAGRIAPRIPHRGKNDLCAFLEDLEGKHRITQEYLSLARDTYDKRAEDLRQSRLSSLLLAREVSGRGIGLECRRLVNFANEFHGDLEDGLEIRSEFTNCAGDISTISWVSNQAYIAGTTVHMDAHNQQYNKPGNLVLGSIASGSATLKAYSDHRIIRPLVERGENSTAAMRASQDAWLYTSVVSSDYDPINNRAYTSGFDKKVKVWSVDKLASGALMRCIGTWDHDGNVNFVQASAFRPEQGTYSFVATAADTPVDAVRIYRVISDMEAQSTPRSFSCSRILNADNTPVDVEKWTYFPSTMKWGIEDSVKHLLLVGYSPRSRTDDDRDIPADRFNTGELCLWDALTGQRVQITSAKTQNVFEVLWHPSQPVFIAATSPIMLKQDINVKTQVRIFKRSELGHFSEIKTLDCMASDINELTVIPNSVKFCYVTAGCTDGKTYVWDTAISDKPIHVLVHGPAIEGVRRNDDEDDTGIKFTAWGSSLDRFYTGSSDGVVKVWNVRTSGKSAKGRVVLEAPAQISFGAFSPDKSKLVIGDASGRVFVLSVDEEDGKPAAFTNLAGPGSASRVRRRIPNPITPHPEPPPPFSQPSILPIGVDSRLGMKIAGQLTYSGDPTVGMVQGLNYALKNQPTYGQTTYFCKEAHNNDDPTQPLLAHIQAVQQEELKLYSSALSHTRPLDTMSSDSFDMASQQHSANAELDLRFENLNLETRQALSVDGVGERELEEGIDYVDIEDDEEAHLRDAKVEVVREEMGREERFWV